MEKSDELKESYYQNMVEDLKTSNPGQWYSKVKRMSSIDPTKDDRVLVEELMNLPSNLQAKKLLTVFLKYRTFMSH